MARNVYVLLNFTRKERYYGTTEKPVRQRVKEQRSGGTIAIRHWNWARDDIRYRTLATGLPDSKAIEKAHKLESRKPPKGWKTIQTGGR
ncbi:MAG: hypothetical protein E3J65_00685 [Dehalococcoidia bacterium]|nr:MAG: hypothetical protein E3J65_00685 [Dehalococcoidia bacterium]